MTPIEALAKAFAEGTGQIGLNAKFLTENGASPPQNFNEELATAFALEGPEPALAVTYDPAKVSPVVEGAFSIPGAQVSFLGYPQANSTVTLRFAQSTGPLAVVIEVVLGGNWTWSTTFDATTGWPFELLTLTEPTFVFSTETVREYLWSGGAPVTLEPGQNFVTTISPTAFGPTFGLLQGVTLPVSLTLAGPIVVDRAKRVGGPQVPGVLAYPEMNLVALVMAGEVKVLGGYLTAKRPRIGLLVKTIEETVDEDGRPLLLESGAPAPPEQLQTPQIFVALDLTVGEVKVELIAPLLDGGLFNVSIAVTPDSKKRLSPAEAIKLVAGPTGESFLGGVPAPLQQFLQSFGLNGLSLGGALSPFHLTQVGAVLGTAPGTEIVLLEDPTGKEKFAIKSFSVIWSLLNPLGPSASRVNAVTIAASLEIWPTVFKGPDGKTPGTFEISIDQTMRVEGQFNGKVEFADLLAAVTDNALLLPKDVVAVTFSDIDLVLDPSARTYAFGCTVDAAVAFIQFNGKPLLSIEGMRFELGATTPAGSGVTAYTGSIVGVIAVGPIAVAVDVRYDGTETPPLWRLRSDLAQPLSLGELVDQFFEPYGLPENLIPRSLTVETFSVDATIPAGTDTSAKSSYAIAGSLQWKIEELDTQLGAKLGLQYDGAQFSGSAIGDLQLGPVEIQVGYAFDLKAKETLWIAWEGLRGTYTSGPPKTVTLTAKGWTLGRLVQGLVRGVGPPDFTLEPPWDFLNKISLDGLSIEVNLSESPPTFTAKYSIGKIDLGFLVIDGVNFTRDKDGKVLLELSGHSTIPGLQSSGLFPENGKKAGRDVTDMPSIPGGGTELFELWLLALGQRVGLYGVESLKDIAAAVKALEAAPGTGGGSNPVDPSQQKPGQPYYDPSAGWLVAVHFGLLKAAGQYMLECAVVFADPDLYGLRLKFAGEKAKVLDGLELDVLYKKVTDDVGVYQVEFSFPKSLRQLDFGAFSVTLPTIGVKVYTNGDFLFDFGFPYNGDFSRSFGMQAQIGPVPVVGALGFYFGRLSVGSEAGLPARYTGAFSPAIVFGVGVSFGVGRYFQKGPLSAGLSLTVFGIVEGTIASWHAAGTKELTTGAETGSSPVQADYFFRLRGSFGLVGKLYGSVDFVVIRADISVTITLSAQITYESFADIELSASASVSISVSLKINLGLFTIKISFSFAATITADLTIANGGTPPWAPTAVAAAEMAALPAATATGSPNFKRVVNVQQQTTVTLRPAPQFTVTGSPGGAPAQLDGAFVFLLAMDAPSADAEDPGTTSFDGLCGVLLPWVIDAYLNPSGDEVDLAAIAATSVSRQQLQEIVDRLSGEGETAIDEGEVEDLLLSQACVVNVEEAMETLAGAAVFPPFGGLSLTAPDPGGGSGTKTIAFDAYVTITEAYRKQLSTLMRQLAARVEKGESGKADAAEGELAEVPEPLNRFLFEDWFGLVAQQLLQAGADAIGDYAYPLAPGDSIGSIVEWAHARGNPDLGIADVVTPNAAHPLAAGVPLKLDSISYVVQAGDSLAAIAARYSDQAETPRWTMKPADLILANAETRGLIASGAEIKLGSGAPYTTQAGDSFALVAEGLGVTVETLAAEQSLYPRTDLLAATRTLAVPTIAYGTAATDTLAGIAAGFDLPLIQLAEDNLDVPGLFAGETIQIANLHNLLVADVWEALKRDRRPAQVAGMVSRFALHGVRLPATEPAGLALPAGFLYPSGEDDYGLYQLSGQQFPTPDFTTGATPSYSVTLAKDAGLSWLRFAGNPATASLPLDLGAQAQDLEWVLGWARKHGFDPEATVTAEPRVQVAPMRYAIPTATPWSTSDAGRLGQIAEAPQADAAPQVQPILWEVPESLLQGVGDRVARLAAAGFESGAIAEYLPAVRPAVGTTDPATRRTTFAALDDFAAATRVQFQVKRLAQEDDLAPERPDATRVVPPGPGNTGTPGPPLAPYAYEVVAPSPGDAVLLERLLLALAGADPPDVADLFLLFENAPGSKGLTSRGSAETVTFLTQTNLATETAPSGARGFAAGAEANGGAPRGFLNSAEEAVKLLWELATVRAGGTYLYYQLPDEGAGLPETVFDSSGVATLTLVVAYARASDLPAAARVTGAVNAFFTTAPIDLTRSVMTLESCPAPAQTRAGDVGGTLGEISDLYGVELGTLGALNATRDLAAVGVPILGATHQLTTADVEAGAYAAVAARFSAGAATPLSAAEVEAYNPGVTAVAGRTLRVPPVTCVIGSPSAPGKTLAELSGYFGLSVDALAAALRDVPAFPRGTGLAVDSQQHDVQDRLGTGNAGLVVNRPRPEEPRQPSHKPTEGEIEAYARASLQTLFTLLSVGVDGSPFFTASRPALPAGPSKPVPPREADAYRHPAERAAALRADAEGPLRYEQTVGFGSVSLLNPAAEPDPRLPRLPPRTANPYLGVGSVLELSVGWLDLFGNRAALAASVGPAAQTAPLGLGYGDRLLGLGRWPNVRATYSYGGTAAAPELALSLRLETDAYANPKTGGALAEADARAFATAFWQLGQDYDGTGVPGLSGRAVSITLVDTLLAEPDVRLDEAQAGEVRGFIAACLEYLLERAEVPPGEDPPPNEGPAAEVRVALSSAPRAEAVIPLSVALRLDRDPLLTDPVLRASVGGLTDSTPVMPVTSEDENDPNVSLQAFALGFEKVFADAESVLRVGTSAALPGESPATREFTLWAVRAARTAGAPGLGFSLADSPSFYAPLPPALTLRNESAEIGQYATGQPFPSGTETPTFTGVDLNAWTQTALAAIDGFLTPTYTAPAFLVDQLTVPEPETNGHLAKILAHKRELAAAIASTASPLLESSASDDATQLAAAEKLEQALLDQLSAMSTVTAVTVLPVAAAHYGDPVPSLGVPPRFYGQPVGMPNELADEDAERNFSLSSAKVPLTADADGASHLAFIFDSRNAAAAANVPLDVAYAATHLEHDITSVPGIDGYQQSAWIAFVTGPVEPLSGSAPLPVDFPVVLRALPKPPSMVAQTATEAHPDPQTPAELAQWDYAFSYLYQSAAQDTVNAVVEWNKPEETMKPKAGDPDADLFAALAQFVTVWPAIEADLESFVRPLDGTATAAPPGAVSALTALESIAGTLATAYTAWADARKRVRGGAEPTHVVYEFDLRLEEEGNRSARIDVVERSLQPPDTKVPIPRVKIAEYTEHEVVPPAQGAQASWTYTGEDGAPPLSYEDALGIAGRTVELAGLDAFTFQDAAASVRVVRNEDLVPSQRTRPEFVFATPAVAFAQPAVPLLDFAAFPLAPEGTKASLATDLDTFLAELLAGAGEPEVAVKLDASYAYRLVPGLEELPETVLPIALLPPTAATGSPPPFLATVANTVTTWLTEVEATDPESRLSFTLEVFSWRDTADQKPLLRIRDLSVRRADLMSDS